MNREKGSKMCDFSRSLLIQKKYEIKIALADVANMS